MHDDAKTGIPASGVPAADAQGSREGAGRRTAPSFGAFARRPARESAAPAKAAEEGLRPEAEASFPVDAVEVGAVIDAYGLKGWVKVAPHAQGGSALLAAKRWWLVKGRERQSAVRVAPRCMATASSGSWAAWLIAMRRCSCAVPAST